MGSIWTLRHRHFISQAGDPKTDPNITKILTIRISKEGPHFFRTLWGIQTMNPFKGSFTRTGHGGTGSPGTARCEDAGHDKGAGSWALCFPFLFRYFIQYVSCPILCASYMNR